MILVQLNNSSTDPLKASVRSGIALAPVSNTRRRSTPYTHSGMARKTWAPGAVAGGLGALLPGGPGIPTCGLGRPTSVRTQTKGRVLS